jgi:hypothetical protein
MINPHLLRLEDPTTTATCVPFEMIGQGLIRSRAHLNFACHVISQFRVFLGEELMASGSDKRERAVITVALQPLPSIDAF